MIQLSNVEMICGKDFCVSEEMMDGERGDE